MKPQEFFDLAEWLLQSKSSPGSFRSVVSRAYYAALHHTIAMLQEMEVTIPHSLNVHEKAPDLLEHSGDTDLVIVGERLRNLREDRNQADYRLSNPNVETEQYAQLRLNDARQVIGAVNTLRVGKNNSGSRFEVAKSAVKARADFLFIGQSSKGAG